VSPDIRQLSNAGSHIDAKSAHSQLGVEADAHDWGSCEQLALHRSSGPQSS
jgi:hypothetical protein